MSCSFCQSPIVKLPFITITRSYRCIKYLTFLTRAINIAQWSCVTVMLLFQITAIIMVSSLKLGWSCRTCYAPRRVIYAALLWKLIADSVEGNCKYFIQPQSCDLNPPPTLLVYKCTVPVLQLFRPS